MGPCLFSEWPRCVSSAGQSDLRGGEDRGSADGERAETQRGRPGGHRSGRGASEDCVPWEVRGPLNSSWCKVCVRERCWVDANVPLLTSGGTKEAQQGTTVMVKLWKDVWLPLLKQSFCVPGSLCFQSRCFMMRGWWLWRSRGRTPAKRTASNGWAECYRYISSFAFKCFLFTVPGDLWKS